ncbi:hypothetical protein PMAYCL1PPCAC_30156 [Pristionchus mayeri]|uniref:Post-GPI attachment to proteins factor 3 n=1 Tax=Pristionchus mayeri TaxID=1317129 RepID=A0AAN5DAL2_9BILA|nr:hypothetical protein PMAYCL1PPCAC_30156 [Pristionchus mayeri]
MRASIALFLLYGRLVLASRGDISTPYQECTSVCRRVHSCPSSFSHQRWTSGDCFWCKYDCMWNAVAVFSSQGLPIPQFHGKWPFYSTFWAQEPASAIFSLLNLLTVNEMRRRVQRLGEGNEERTEYSVMRRVWIGYTIVGIVTWVCSTWFHCTDHLWSERADYFTAFAFVLYANYAALLFTFPSLRRGWRSSGISTVCLLFYLRHVSNMSSHFDYGWNMALCIGCSVCTLLTYLVYLFRRWRRFGSLSSLRRSDRMLLLVLTWTVAAVSMELHDFVPFFFSVDAHALFHAATIPLPLFTAHFLELNHRESGFEYAKIV